LTITRSEAADMAHAHAEGLHADLPREGCPECEERELRDYPEYLPGARIRYGLKRSPGRVVRSFSLNGRWLYDVELDADERFIPTVHRDDLLPGVPRAHA
jgi:hypothetical protein